MATEYKLKDLTSLSSLANDAKQEASLEGLDDATILLAKVGNQVHALSAKCTHYGVPLSKGVLTPDGRLRCMAHGACFKVSTGDVEDAPALDPLSKFEVYERDGGVYIKGEESAIKAKGRTLDIKCSAKGEEKVVIVGGGSGAIGAIDGLRGGGFKGAITCVTAEETPFIDRTKLSKALIGDASKLAWRTEDYYKSGDVEILHGNVTSVDFAGSKVKLGDGKEVPYTKLVLASGGQARMLPLPGLKGDLGNVFPLRVVSDVQSILKAAGEDGGKKVVVVGSSFIGMEVGNALAGKGHHVEIVGMEKEPMERVMGTQVGSIFRKLLEKNGVKFHMSAQVDKGIESSAGNGKIAAVQLKEGTTIAADLVVEGVGIKPATDYLKDNMAVTLEKDGSLRTDEAFAVTGLKNVFAIGDIATYPYNGPGGAGKPVRIEHWNVAQNAGRSVARSIATPAAKPKSFIPVFWSAMGSQLRYCGHTPEGFDDVVIDGETDVSEGKHSFVAYYCKGETVVAVASMAKDPYMTQCVELMRRGKMPGKSELKKGVDPFGVSLPAEVKI